MNKIIYEFTDLYKELFENQKEEKEKIQNKVIILSGVIQLLYVAFIFLFEELKNDIGEMNTFIYFRMTLLIIFLLCIFSSTISAIFCLYGFKYQKEPSADMINETYSKAFDKFDKDHAIKYDSKHYKNAKKEYANQQIMRWLTEQYSIAASNNYKENSKKLKRLNTCAVLFYITLVLGGVNLLFYVINHLMK